MESYKDVVVSQLPTNKGQATTVNKISLENYKGILLCDPPIDNSGNRECGKTFVPGGRTGNPLGCGPSVEERELRKEHQNLRDTNVQTQRSQNQALSRHKMWLKSFAKQVKAMQQNEIDREIEAAERAERLRKAEVQRRAVLTSSQQPTVHQEPYNMQQRLDPFKGATNAGGKSSTTKKQAKGKAKPQWAMTEEEALDAELDANNDLLDFAKNLDYDKFINDYEVTEALCVMRDRVRELARENNWTEDDIRRAGEDNSLMEYEDETEENRTKNIPAPLQPSGATRPNPAVPSREANAALPGSAAQHDKDWDSSTGRSRTLNQSIRKDALLLAERLLEATPSMQKVHTKYSLARMLQQCALAGDVNVNPSALGSAGGSAATPGQNYSSGAGASAAVGGPALAEPRVVQVNAEATTGNGSTNDGQGRILRDLQTSKERTQGLAYLYRCPAI